MDINTINEVAYKLMRRRKAHLEREKGFIYYHGLRVSKISVNLRKLILMEDDSYDDILTVSGLFHDVAKGIEPHGQNGAVLVKEILKDYCTEDEIIKVADIIYYHNIRKKDNEYSEYIKIMQDADILDHFGTIEVWMNFFYQAHRDGSIKDSLQFYNDEYDIEVKKCRELLNYEVSRKIFDDKVSFTSSFVNRFKKEAEGEFCFEI